jgi:hypothetical protein
MPKFVTIGYGDRAGYERSPKDVRDAAYAHDAELKKRGALMGIAGVPVKVRNTLAGGVRKENSAFMSSALPVAGFAVIDAADLAEAIQIASQTPARLRMALWKCGLWSKLARGAEPARRLRLWPPYVFCAFTTRMGLPSKKASAFSTLCG